MYLNETDIRTNSVDNPEEVCFLGDVHANAEIGALALDGLEECLGGGIGMPLCSLGVRLICDRGHLCGSCLWAGGRLETA